MSIAPPQKNNQLGERHVHFQEAECLYCVDIRKKRRGKVVKRIRKRFKDRDEAIRFRDEVLE